MRRASLALLAGLMLSWCAGASQAGSDPAPGKAVLAHRIDTAGFGTWTGLRLGDLDGDRRRDIVVAQNRSQNITCVTALDVTGKQLWRVGQPHAGGHRAGSDVPVQVYDLDQDGQNEVVYIAEGKVKIVDGKTGRLEREGPLPAPKANDSIAFADFSGRDQPQDIVVKTRYSQVWALGRNLDVLWTHKGNTGHYPWPHDFDGDGRDELACGFALLGPDGRKLWEAGLPGHADAVAVGNVDGDPDNGDEIALACCGGNTFALLGRDGRIRWKHPCGHSQHIIIGDFRPDLPGQELAALDRGNDRSASGVDAIILYAADGTQLWREKRMDDGPNRWLTIITTVRNWDASKGDLILAHRRGGSTCPTLYDGHGRPVATFPFPHPERQHFAQHGDLFGDGREEIVVWNEKRIHIYTNGAPHTAKAEPHRGRPNKRLYNYTAYIGMP
ncbi:MAG: PQQ-binding-like beta-propeller repeat protein [Planctomycetota bacterium]